MYVTTQAGIDQYDQGAGTLSPKNPPSVPVASGVAGIAETPDRTSVYATGQFSPAILLFDVGTGGTLAPKATPTLSLPGGAVPAGIAVSPDGQSVYVSFSTLAPPSSAGIAQYTVGAGGALTPKNPPTVPAGSGPAGGVTVNPEGTSVYTANSGDGTVSQYSVGAGGRLSPRARPPSGPGAPRP